jgi:hypothetical protein
VAAGAAGVAAGAAAGAAGGAAGAAGVAAFAGAGAFGSSATDAPLNIQTVRRDATAPVTTLAPRRKVKTDTLDICVGVAPMTSFTFESSAAGDSGRASGKASTDWEHYLSEM